MSEKIILLKEAEKAKKERDRIVAARNKASFLINDAKARYVKQKTRAKSKKAALERDAVLNSDRFKPLDEYYRFEDINEAYGYDCITESQRDKLEKLWEEREQIKSQTFEGVFRDDVTDMLDEAWIFLQDFQQDQIDACEAVEKEFKKQKHEADVKASEWMRRQNAEYDKLCRRE